MYDFVTHTWNTIKGQCYHDCSYCYMKRWGKLKPVRFDENELETDLGKDNFIFVGSSCDMFNEMIPADWIRNTLIKCNSYNNKYLFQSKNCERMIRWIEWGYLDKNKTLLCATLETNKWYRNIMNKSDMPWQRAFDFKYYNGKKYITIEPIMEFDLDKFVKMIKECEPIQVNIGADSGNNNLPEPSPEKILELIQELDQFTKVNIKPNLKRIMIRG